jgi:hypothetical protein
MKVDFSNEHTPTPPPTFGKLKPGECYTLPGGNTLYMKVSYASNWNYVVNLETGGLLREPPNGAVVFPRPLAVVKVNG